MSENSSYTGPILELTEEQDLLPVIRLIQHSMNIMLFATDNPVMFTSYTEETDITYWVEMRDDALEARVQIMVNGTGLIIGNAIYMVN